MVSSIAAGAAPWATVLAGGESERMQPLIRSWLGYDRPKPYCAFLGDHSMLRHTLDRVRDVVPPDRTMTVINGKHRGFLDQALSGQTPGRLFEQPVDRGTAPGVFLPVTQIMEEDPEATVLILPSDHFVFPSGALRRPHPVRKPAARSVPGLRRAARRGARRSRERLRLDRAGTAQAGLGVASLCARSARGGEVPGDPPPERDQGSRPQRLPVEHDDHGGPCAHPVETGLGAPSRDDATVRIPQAGGPRGSRGTSDANAPGIGTRPRLHPSRGGGLLAASPRTLCQLDPCPAHGRRALERLGHARAGDQHLGQDRQTTRIHHQRRRRRDLHVSALPNPARGALASSRPVRVPTARGCGGSRASRCSCADEHDLGLHDGRDLPHAARAALG